MNMVDIVDASFTYRGIGLVPQCMAKDPKLLERAEKVSLRAIEYLIVTVASFLTTAHNTSTSAILPST